MSDYKHPKAIHKETNKLVTAFKLTEDISWIGRERDKFIALSYDLPEDVKEVEMIYVNKYARKNGVDVYPHFRKKPGQSDLISNRGGESKAHKFAKEQVYERLWNGELKIDGKPLDLDLVDDLDIEYRTSKKGYVIPDVIVLFKDIHPIYGKGIVVEIQLSEQSDDKTIERSYERIIRGYSVVWIFGDNINLIEEGNLEVTNYREAIDKFTDDKYIKFQKEINKIGLLFDEKRDSYIEEINSTSKETLETIKSEKYNLKNELTNELYVKTEKLSDLINFKDEELKDKIINRINSVEFKDVISHLINHINNIVKARSNYNGNGYVDKKGLFSEGEICPECKSKNCNSYNDSFVCFECKYNTYNKR